MKPIGEYLQSKCMRLIEYVVLDADRTGWVKRFTNTTVQPRGPDRRRVSGGHLRPQRLRAATLPMAPRRTLLSRITIEFTDDISGSADYKKYSGEASYFTLGR